ncbi:gliding motility lipoprotein GldH [Ochrovirga pacifica]|uniref:gliding motility lipoprotein GldH n=1 Tax=Ochrovirga pacifica TaxID=1042376 RepID=UPI00025591ED|nr:gliding motility lipoprotein GldH [Ochrovirga pacifica]
MERQKANKILFTIWVLILVACDHPKYDTYKTLGNTGWPLDQPVSFEVNLEDVSKPHHVFLNVRTDKEYPYRNLYLISKVTFPDGIAVKDTLEYQMTDAYGNWLGTGLTDVKDNALYFLENYTFPEPGNYKFQFTQAMRKRGDLQGLPVLQGVRDFGLRIEEVQN